MKYGNEEVRMLIAEKHQGVNNYFTDSLLYQDSLETANNLSPEVPDYDNEADAEPEPEEEYLWELNLFVRALISSILITSLMLKASDLLMKI